MNRLQYMNYTYQIKFSSKDCEFIGTCLEFPSLSYLNTNPVYALMGIMNTVKNIIHTWNDSNPPPQPINQ